MRFIKRKTALAVVILTAIAGLSGCSESIDHDALEAELRSRLELIEEAQVTRADWGPSGVGEAVLVDLQLERDDEALAEAVANAALDAIADIAIAADYSRDAKISLLILSTDAARGYINDDFGLPGSMDELLEGR